MRLFSLALLLLSQWSSAEFAWSRAYITRLCDEKCAGTWSRLSVNFETDQTVLQEQRGSVTSLWRFKKNGQRARLYSGPLRTWRADIGEYLVGLKPDNTVFVYDFIQERLLWSQQPSQYDLLDLEERVFENHQVLAVIEHNPKAEGGKSVTMYNLRSGAFLGWDLSPYKRPPQTAFSPVPMNLKTRLRRPVVEHTFQNCRVVALEGRSGSGARWLEGWVARGDVC